MTNMTQLLKTILGSYRVHVSCYRVHVSCQILLTLMISMWLTCIFIMSMDVWAGKAIFTYYWNQRGHCIKLGHVAMNLYRLYFG